VNSKPSRIPISAKEEIEKILTAIFVIERKQSTEEDESG